MNYNSFFLIALAWVKLKYIAYPAYKCQDCIGMQAHGCQCAYYGAYSPTDPHGPWYIRLLRKVLPRP